MAAAVRTNIITSETLVCMWRTNFKFMTYVTKTWQDTGNEQPPDTRIAAAILVQLTERDGR